jgi:hypothetical protein
MDLRGPELFVGQRYLHGKTSKPVTLRYIGVLPTTPTASAPRPTSSSSGGSTVWLGIEYDDPSHGKHSGTYQGEKVFDVTVEGAGAFVKASPGVLKEGATLVEALEERYGSLLPPENGAQQQSDRTQESKGLSERVVLGTSGIVVDAPGLSAVQARIGRLERLREVGLDYQWVAKLGGTDEQRGAMRTRLKSELVLSCL